MHGVVIIHGEQPDVPSAPGLRRPAGHRGIFTFEVDITGVIYEMSTRISFMMPYTNKWTHIKYMLTVMNHGIHYELRYGVGG